MSYITLKLPKGWMELGFKPHQKSGE